VQRLIRAKVGKQMDGSILSSNPLALSGFSAFVNATRAPKFNASLRLSALSPSASSMDAALICGFYLFIFLG